MHFSNPNQLKIVITTLRYVILQTAYISWQLPHIDGDVSVQLDHLPENGLDERGLASPY